MGSSSTVDVLRERYRRTARAFAVLESIVPDMVTLMEAGIERVPIEQQLTALSSLHTLALPAALAQLQRDVSAFEDSFDQLDRKIPSRWFRQHCRVSATDAEGFADYCQLLAFHVGANDLARLERIRFLVEGLTEAVWPRAWATVEQRRELAAQALPPASLEREAVRGAVAYLTASAARAAQFACLEELLVSDFIVETRGWVLALREKVLDPAIVIATNDLEYAIAEAMRRFAAMEATNEDELREYLDAAGRRLEGIFTALTEADEQETEQGFKAFQRRRAEWKAKLEREEQLKARAERRRKEREQWNPPKRRWPKPVAIALLAGLVWLRMPTTSEDLALKPEDVATLSGVLESAAVAPPRKPRALVAKVEPHRWAMLGKEERRGVAAELAAALRERGLENGTVFDGESIAVEIRKGEVFIVR